MIGMGPYRVTEHMFPYGKRDKHMDISWLMRTHSVSSVPHVLGLALRTSI